MPRQKRQWIQRQGAIAALENALDYPLIMVIAPAGYGKTALAAQYAALKSGNAAWVALSEAEREPAQLAALIQASLFEARPSLRNEETGPASNANGLLALLRRADVGPLVILVDDFQHIDASAPAVALLYELSRSLPEGVNIIALSRVVPAQSINPLIARQQATVVGTRALCFQENETREAIARLRGISPGAISDNELEVILTATEGWPMGVALHEQSRALAAESGPGQELIDEYLTASVFAGTQPGTLDFMMRAAESEAFTEARAIALGGQEAVDALRDAQRQNLFLSGTTSDAKPSSRLHPLVRAFLRRQYLARNPVAPEGSAQAAAAPGDVTPMQIDVKPAPVRIEARAFGIGRVWRNGELLTTSQWGYNIPRELFFFMLTARSSLRERVGAVFWPEASTSAMQRGFHNAKFAIRNALKEPAILYADGVYTINPDMALIYDVGDFERMISAAARANNDEALKLLLAAAELYTDDFLIDSSLDWALEVRRRLETKFVRCCIEAASIALHKGHPEQVSELLTRAYYRDRTREELARALIHAHAMMGNRTVALDTYADLQSTLQRELGIAPQPESESLAQRLRAGQSIASMLPPARRAPTL
ncbi:MAG: hypothetical protein K1X39_02635 [Thermoflexales bacterium]|nr:hypothetical protein [Thermoflexales bacterium]